MIAKKSSDVVAFARSAAVHAASLTLTPSKQLPAIAPGASGPRLMSTEGDVCVGKEMGATREPSRSQHRP